MAPLVIDPPLLNSANPWCTTLEQLQELYASPHTGAITTRTSLLDDSGFPHDPAVHQFTFYNPANHAASTPNHDYTTSPNDDADDALATSSLNTLGYSPLPLSTYLSFAATLSATHPPAHKPIILSVTGTAAAAAQCYRLISTAQHTLPTPLAMELNLSCPNIPGQAPPAYSRPALAAYLAALRAETQRLRGPVPLGIKIPPYTFRDQFEDLVGALLDSADGDGECPVSFVTAVNTLGCALLLGQGASEPVLASAAGDGVGGLAGAALHPLALGNVAMLSALLARHAVLAPIRVIGVGGVADAEGYRRMRAVGASAVAVGTALGRKGVRVFAEIDAAGVEEERRKVEEMEKVAG